MTQVDGAYRTDAEVYALHADALVQFACGLVGRSEASDVVSAAVVKVLASKTWPTVLDQRAFLFRAVYNEAMTLRRRQVRWRQLSAPQRAAPWELPDFAPEVRSAVAALSVRQRAVVFLTYWADMTPADVAAALGISDGSVRRHLARARAQLRRSLDA